MIIDNPKILARQLKHPQGELAIQVGKKMSEENLRINLNTIDALKLSPNDNILEIGMGNGFFVKDIFHLDSSIKYTGCDHSKIMVEEAHQQNVQFIINGQANFIRASVEKLPFNNEVFDKVFSVHSIYFWDSQELALSEIHRVLKQKGRITIAIRPKSLMEHYSYVKFGFKTFSKDDLSKLLLDNNFREIETFEKEEYEKELNGEIVKVNTLLINAVK
jgi:ubiquinone/menaquinone biosynthesis C-methylase UbiE